MGNPDNISIVLVNTSHPGNIGAAARAMKNMGLSELILVDPVDFPSGVAVGRAVSAVDILESARVVATLEEAVADCSLVIGTSARSRKIPWPMVTPEECADKIASESSSAKTAIVFGREDSGLNNDELQLCTYHVQIPTNPGYSSLNLAAAVMVICYEVLKQLQSEELSVVKTEEDYWDQERATGQQLEHFFEHLERVMTKIRFHDPENPRLLMQRMRRLYTRVRLDVMEMNILRGILTNIEFNLKETPQALNPEPDKQMLEQKDH
jgi:tRNA (cytidine32/uridine32-2'-O)-methyltransferase